MVYCSKCGTKNDETAHYCVKCGAKLDGPEKSWEKHIEENAEEFGRRTEEWGENFGKQFEQGACFGLAHAGLAFLLVIGILIIIVGVLSLAGIAFWRSFWAIAIILFGVMVLGGAIYTLIQRH